MKLRDIQHLYWRAGFGITPFQLDMLSKKDKIQIIDMLFQASSKVKQLQVDTSEIDDFTFQMFRNKKKRQEFATVSTEKLKEFNIAWFNRLSFTKEILREKMTLFWANHFVCRDDNIYYVSQYNNVLRRHALGDFRTFVKAISKEPAMLKYLNSKQNKKQNPNENFARELMELFTLGEGFYKESDIQESARTFTGYNNNFQGDFMLNERDHDFGNKTFLGRTGPHDGDDIIDIILEQKQCARFICGKIYKYFVNETVDDRRVEELTTLFYKDYNIESLMRYIFMSDWFYAEENMGVKIKSPIELLVGLRITVPIQFEKDMDLFKIQKLLGQTLLNPPNVAGWQGGKNWIDSNTIMIRLKIPSILLANAVISVREEGEFEDSFAKYIAGKRKNKFINTKVDWNSFDEQYKSISNKDLTNSIIAPKLSAGTETYLETLSKSSKRDICIQLMSLPEYQMC